MGMPLRSHQPCHIAFLLAQKNIRILSSIIVKLRKYWGCLASSGPNHSQLQERLHGYIFVWDLLPWVVAFEALSAMAHIGNVPISCKQMPCNELDPRGPVGIRFCPRLPLPSRRRLCYLKIESNFNFPIIVKHDLLLQFTEELGVLYTTQLPSLCQFRHWHLKKFNTSV